MLDLTKRLDPVWPDDLMPIGEGSFEKEDFQSWWGRHKARVGHLHPTIAETWIYRHWLHSPFAFVPIETITWELTELSGDEILATVRREFAGPLNPEFDYGAFQESYFGKKLATSFALDQGTWDYPIITLKTPNGTCNFEGVYPDVRLVLVEGHQRHRYLNALHALGKAPQGPHKVFQLSSPRAL